MSDNTILPGAGDTVRAIDRSGTKTQVMALDVGGAAGESLVSQNNPVPVADTTVGGLIMRVLQVLLAPLGYDKSLARYRQTAVVESGTITTVTTVATLTTCAGLTNIDGRNGSMLINANNATAWALNVRSRIS